MQTQYLRLSGGTLALDDQGEGPGTIYKPKCLRSSDHSFSAS
jgi:hypothetical protein